MKYISLIKSVNCSTLDLEQKDSEKIYFVDVHLHNNEDYDINVQWSEAGQQKEENIPAGDRIAHSVVLKAKRFPDPAIYTAYESTDNGGSEVER